ncbi:MAG: SGNH/GDSL hydrolase family protein [Phycisphaerae bacterium]|nr:SGNH/GDSL hydrolase family protein [Tepidisphaeraceae bacterium]
MSIKRMARRVLGLAVAATVLGFAPVISWADNKPAATAAPAGNALQKNDFVAICGDSITEQKQYSVYMQSYLLMCKPAGVNGDLRAMQFGWSGETSWGFLGKMSTQALKFPMTVATTCYGMNDGGYSPMTDAKAKKYTEAHQGIIDAFKKHGVRFIVLGSPGAVDADTFLRPDPTDPEPDAKKKRKVSAAPMYNATLAAERDIIKALAEKNGLAFADVHGAMVDAMTKAKAKYGPKYHVGGGDGVHPAANGQLCMAYAFLKGLGVDGHIGTITVDLAGNKAEATDGHKVLSAAGGKIEVESEKYPFCFYGDPAQTNSTSGIIEFLPFNQDLNRYLLVVKNAGAAKVKVTWGKNSKEFDAAALEKGINLAAEFIADNPFSEPFKKVEAVIRAQQNAETPLVKKTLNDLPKAKDKDAATKAAVEEMKKAKELFDASAATAKQPVKHTIAIEAVK